MGFFARGRIRPVEEIILEIQRVDARQVNEMLAKSPLGPFTIVTVGPQELTVPGQAVAAE